MIIGITTKPSNVIIEQNKNRITITKSSPLNIDMVSVGKQGLKGAKGDNFTYNDLTVEQKQDFINSTELDNGTLNTDLLANYILNKD